MALEARYKRLKNEDGSPGGWGAKVFLGDDPFSEYPRPGEKVTITKQNGDTSERTLANLIFEGVDDPDPAKPEKPSGPFACFGLK